MKLAKNVTDRPAIITADGRSLGGGEWGAVDVDLELVDELRRSGVLQVLPDGYDFSGPDVPTDLLAAGVAAGLLAPDAAGTVPDPIVALGGQPGDELPGDPADPEPAAPAPKSKTRRS